MKKLAFISKITRDPVLRKRFAQHQQGTPNLEWVVGRIHELMFEGCEFPDEVVPEEIRAGRLQLMKQSLDQNWLTVDDLISDLFAIAHGASDPE